MSKPESRDEESIQNQPRKTKKKKKNMKERGWETRGNEREGLIS